jgi:diguanylate cyclase (GGDEF)-like protein
LKLQVKILLVVVPLVVIPLLVLGGIAYEQMKGSLWRSRQNELDVRLQQIRYELRSMRRTALANVELFAGARLVRDYVLETSKEDRYELFQPALLSLFASYQRAYPEYEEIRILLPDGYEDARYARADIGNATEFEAELPVFKALQASDQQRLAMIGRSRDTGRQVMYVGRKLVLSDPSVESNSVAPTLRGYLVLTVSLAALRESMRNNVPGQNGVILIASNVGDVLLSAPPLEQKMQDAVQKWLVQLGSGHDHGLLEVMLNGRAHVFAGAAIPGQMFALAGLPFAELDAENRLLALLVTLITLVTTSVVVVTLMLLLRKMVISPLHRLGEAAGEIGRGNLETGLDVTGGDEIGALAKAFRKMARNLAETTDRIRFLAYHDPLTGLPNRRMFQEYLDHALALAARNESRLALLFLDVDNFKKVNDSLGHQAGDKLLRILAERFNASLRQGDYVSHPDLENEYAVDTLSRLGGDEFTFILTDIRQPLAEARVAQRLLEALSRPVRLGSHEIVVTGSIGITRYPDDGRDSGTLIKNADIAMYHAKENGKNNFQFFTDSINAAVQEKLILENRLRQALEQNELSLHYQPLIDAGNGEITACEALMRWQSPELGMIPPDSFIPVAEETGLIIAMGRWALEQAMRQIVAWQGEGIRPVPIAVNLSSVQLLRGGIDAELGKLLRKYDIDPQLLVLELTETTLI